MVDSGCVDIVLFLGQALKAGLNKSLVCFEQVAVIVIRKGP